MMEEAQPDEGTIQDALLSGRWLFCQLLQYRTSDSQPTEVRAAQLGHMWTLPFQNRCQLSGFCGRLAILMFTHNVMLIGIGPQREMSRTLVALSESLP